MPDLDDAQNAPEARNKPPGNVIVETHAGGLTDVQLAILADKVIALLRREMIIERERQVLPGRR
jgi:hypothetical protein